MPDDDRTLQTQTVTQPTEIVREADRVILLERCSSTMSEELSMRLRVQSIASRSVSPVLLTSTMFNATNVPSEKRIMFITSSYPLPVATVLQLICLPLLIARGRKTVQQSQMMGDPVLINAPTHDDGDVPNIIIRPASRLTECSSPCYLLSLRMVPE